VIRRFQIEDLIVQDPSGVVFRALDTETGRTVAVRRFFPFGADGGGLHADEQTAYVIAVGRLAGLRHPALRSVICGGCDPVDGMPFIATEWIEGESLQPIIERGPLSAEDSTQVIIQALEVCELLSHVLAEEAVWVETELPTIIVGNEPSGRGLTFWISPLKWLGGDHESRGLESIITLTEEIMGWRGQVVSEQAGLGLGAWIKWLRGAAATTTLQEAREMLAASVGAAPPIPARSLVAQATVSIGKVGKAAKAGKSGKPRPAKRPWVATFALILGLTLVIAGLAGLLIVRHRAKQDTLQIPTPTILQSAKPEPGKPKPEPAKPQPEKSPQAPTAKPAAANEPVSETERIAQLNRRAAELSAQAGGGGTLAEQQAQAGNQGGVVPASSRELLLQNEGKALVIEGVVTEIGPSSSGKTIFLWFADRKLKNVARAGTEIADAPPKSVIDKLTPMVGKKVQIGGTVVVRNNRPDVIFKDVASIKVIE
jgi:hypothetical protein